MELGEGKATGRKVGAAAFFKGPGWVLSHGSASISQGLFDIPFSVLLCCVHLKETKTKNFLYHISYLSIGNNI